MKKLLALALLLFALPALAQVPAQPPIPYIGVPGFDPSNQAANFNQLTSLINAILSPAFPLVPSAVNFIQLIPAPPGGTAQININPGAFADRNAPLSISANGNGNIILFPTNPDALSTGKLLIGNQASFVPTKGIAGCPAVVPGQPPASFGSLGNVSDHVTGYFVIDDWLGRPHGVVAC